MSNWDVHKKKLLIVENFCIKDRYTAPIMHLPAQLLLTPPLSLLLPIVKPGALLYYIFVHIYWYIQPALWYPECPSPTVVDYTDEDDTSKTDNMQHSKDWPHYI